MGKGRKKDWEIRDYWKTSWSGLKIILIAYSKWEAWHRDAQVWRVMEIILLVLELLLLFVEVGVGNVKYKYFKLFV